jgi:hypothetical protein
MTGSLLLWGQLLNPTEVGISFRCLPDAALALFALV